MKQVTVRFGELGAKELEKSKEFFGIKKNATVIEHAMLQFRHLVNENGIQAKKITELEDHIKELEIVIKHLWERK